MDISVNIEIPAIRHLTQVLEYHVAEVADLKEAAGQLGNVIAALTHTVSTSVERVMARLDSVAQTNVSIAEVTQQLKGDMQPLQAVSDQLQKLANDPSVPNIPQSNEGLTGLETAPTTPTPDTPAVPAPTDQSASVSQEATTAPATDVGTVQSPAPTTTELPGTQPSPDVAPDQPVNVTDTPSDNTEPPPAV